jgi:serine/threonine protein kinase
LWNPTVDAVNRNDLHRISLLGKGAFSNVYLVTNEQRTKLAMKCIDPLRLAGPDELLSAATDLANEAMILSRLEEHPNVIQLRGVSSTTFSQSFGDATGGGIDSSTEGYFLLLDYLPETLSDRLDRWRRDRRNGTDPTTVIPWTIFPCGNRPRRTRLDVSRMYRRMETVALGIAAGMAHVHSHGIVVRDLKPANVGFDETGTVRLFDFGMARSVEDCRDDCGEVCGTARYMSPQALSGRGYTFPSDVYSFGVLLYELCSLEIPYEDIQRNKPTRRRIQTLDDFRTLVVDGNVRPSSSRIPCAETRRLIEECWDANDTQRPSFPDIVRRLRDIVNPKD